MVGESWSSALVYISASEHIIIFFPFVGFSDPNEDFYPRLMNGFIGVSDNQHYAHSYDDILSSNERYDFSISLSRKSLGSDMLMADLNDVIGKRYLNLVIHSSRWQGDFVFYKRSAKMLKLGCGSEVSGELILITWVIFRKELLMLFT